MKSTWRKAEIRKKNHSYKRKEKKKVFEVTIILNPCPSHYPKLPLIPRGSTRPATTATFGKILPSSGDKTRGWTRHLWSATRTHQAISAARKTERGTLTSVSLEDMGFQAAVVGGLEGAQLAAERFVVSMVGLHVAVQAWGETQKGDRKASIVPAVPSEAKQSTLQQQQNKQGSFLTLSSKFNRPAYTIKSI